MSDLLDPQTLVVARRYITDISLGALGIHPSALAKAINCNASTAISYLLHFQKVEGLVTLKAYVTCPSCHESIPLASQSAEQVQEEVHQLEVAECRFCRHVLGANLQVQLCFFFTSVLPRGPLPAKGSGRSPARLVTVSASQLDEIVHLQRALETMILSQRKTLALNRPLVISLHGIMTTGKWQKDLALEVGEIITYAPLDFGVFGVLSFLNPWKRQAQVTWFRDEYERIRTKCGDRMPSIVAHSFGTHIVAQALKKYPDMQFDRVIFCGSIVDQGYDWNTLFKANRVQGVLNDFGGKDFWVWVARFGVWSSGRSGRYGFNQQSPRLFQRKFQEFRHSDFFYARNFRGNWLPFLQGQDPRPIEVFEKSAWNWGCIGTVVLVTVFCYVILAAIYHWVPFRT